MLLSQSKTVWVLFALGAALCLLPGCGGSGSSLVTSQTPSSTSIVSSRSLNQSFTGLNTALATFTLVGPLDQTKPFSVSVDGVPLVYGKDYAIDPSFLNSIHITSPLLPTSSVLVQGTTFPTETLDFTITNTSQRSFTLSPPARLNAPLSVQVNTSDYNIGGTAGGGHPLSSQDYTIIYGPPTVLHLTNPLTPQNPLTTSLSITYIPKVP